MSATPAAHTLLMFLIAGAASHAAPAAAPRVPPAKARPNILFIPVDDMRPELGCYGSRVVKSPNIDALAKDGVVFTQAHCSQAVCNPSRASLLTGLRPDTIRVWDLFTDFRKTAPNAVTVLQHFKANGYYTVGTGKTFHNSFDDPVSWSEPENHLPGYPFDPDATYVLTENNNGIEAVKKQLIAEGKEKSRIDRFGKWYLKTVVTECADVPDNAYYDGAQTDWAMEKLKELKAKRQPFFLSVGYYRPHMPFNAPKKYWDLYDRATLPLADNQYVPKDAPIMAQDTNKEIQSYVEFKGHSDVPSKWTMPENMQRLMKHGYYASVSYTDAQIGKLVQALKDEGLYENTIIVLWGDHGWKLGEHNGWGKMTNYEIDTRSLLVVRDPRLKTGRRVDRLVEFVDIYPTLCELTGLPLRPELEGTSFVPLLKNPKRSWKPAVFSQYQRAGYFAAADGKEYMGYSMRTGRYRYVEWRQLKTGDAAGVEIYDHKTDPQENENLALKPGQAALVKRLAAQLKAGWKAARPRG